MALKLPGVLPLLLHDQVVLPGASIKITVGDPRSMNLVQTCLWSGQDWKRNFIGIVSRRSEAQSKNNKSGLDDLHPIGTAVRVLQIVAISQPKPCFYIVALGFCRFRIKAVRQEMPFLKATVAQLDRHPGEEEKIAKNSELQSLAQDFRSSCIEFFNLLNVGPSVKDLISSLPLHVLPDIISQVVKASFEERREILDAVNFKERLEKASALLSRQVNKLIALDVAKATEDTSPSPNRTVHMFVSRNNPSPNSLRQLLGSDNDEMQELEERLKAAKMPEAAMKAATKELKRLRKMPSVHPEHAVVRNYLELMADLPWSHSTDNHVEIEQARTCLDEDHYGLKVPKKRVLEYLAVRKLRNSLRGPILCLVGPPGVGKTSVGRSIARSLGRQFFRVSLGGVSDEADIRGHRRTYIGSMPGRIIAGLRTVGVNNPVFLLDEIDKLTRSVRGDPAAALLEVLDPEQNSTFTDHYITVPFDLSQVLFIATANSTSSIPPALKDRMEVIRIAGYTEEEKLHIAVRHLVPKQLKEHGITGEQLQLPMDTLSAIVTGYTREAGVRSLERKIGAVCRAVALKLAENHMLPVEPAVAVQTRGEPSTAVESSGSQEETDSVGKALQLAVPITGLLELPIVVTVDMLDELLGPPDFEHDRPEQLVTPGVAMGLVWTPAGGELLYVEASQMAGKGRLTVTGNLGDVMKESADIALSWIRAHSQQYGLVGMKENIIDGIDLHLHFPAGAVGKEGPSAGVTILVVFMSLFTGRCVRSDTAMTGEITLRGQVLPVGGVKEKVLAAHRGAVHRVILPRRNEKDLNDIPQSVKEKMEFHLVSEIHEVLQAAFDRGFFLHSRL